jgi:adenosylmethionine-8-amino-7-oxononanoate aminotransferase
VRVFDPAGKSYIDCTSQSWALYLGYCHEELWAAIDEQARLMTHVHQGFDTLPRFYLARKLAEIAPGDLNRVSFTVGGGAAFEAAMKIPAGGHAEEDGAAQPGRQGRPLGANQAEPVPPRPGLAGGALRRRAPPSFLRATA